MSEIYQPYSRSNAGYNPFNSFHYYMHHFKQQPFCFKLSNLCVHDNILEKLESKGALLLFKSCMDHRNKKKDKREMVATQYFFQWKDSIICLDRTKDSSDDDYPAFSAGASFDEKINNNSFWVHILYTQEETLKELQKLFEYKELTKKECMACKGFYYPVSYTRNEGKYGICANCEPHTYEWCNRKR